MAGGRRHDLHLLFRLHPVPGLRPCDQPREGRLFRPQRCGRGQPLPGAGNRAVGHRGPRQHRGRRGGRRHRRAGGDVLDDPRGPARHGLEVHRMHPRREVPQRVPGRPRLGRPDVLHDQGLQGTRPSRRRLHGGAVLDLLHRRRARRRQHVPGQPGPCAAREHLRRLSRLDHRRDLRGASSSR